MIAGSSNFYNNDRAFKRVTYDMSHLIIFSTALIERDILAP